MNYLIKIAYDGSKFYGFQRLNEEQSVQTMAVQINNSLKSGFNGCVFKLCNYDYKIVCTLIQMLKEADYFTTLMHVKDKGKTNYYLRVELITRGKKE